MNSSRNSKLVRSMAPWAVRVSRSAPERTGQGPMLRRVSGLTLIELLVVIVILGVLVAAVLPVLAPTTNERRLREASRGLNTFISLAMAKAIGEGKPYGIGLRKLSASTGNPNDRPVCVEVFLVEQPNPYVGFSEGSAVRIASNFRDANRSIQGNYPPINPDPNGIDYGTTFIFQFVTLGTGVEPGQDGAPYGIDPDLFPSGVIRPGDVIEVGTSRFEILELQGSVLTSIQHDPITGYFKVNDGMASAGRVPALVARPLNETGQNFSPVTDAQGQRLTLTANNTLTTSTGSLLRPFWSEPQSYRIIRQPTATSTAPYQLPEGAAIDLQGSGFESDAPLVVENNGVPPSSPVGTRNNDDPIFIMFSPDGSIESVRYNRGGDGTAIGVKDFLTIRAVANMNLLVGLRENLPVDITLLPDGSETEVELEEMKAKVNWTNLEARWVSIGGQSGSVVTAEVAFIDPIAAKNNAVDIDGFGGIDPLDIRREQIRQSRAFAREMNREGGN